MAASTGMLAVPDVSRSRVIQDATYGSVLARFATAGGGVVKN